MNIQGVGLGLIISNSLAINLNKGKKGLDVKSWTEGADKGTEFTLSLSDFQEGLNEKRNESIDNGLN
jgi:hypothetical protein